MLSALAELISLTFYYGIQGRYRACPPSEFILAFPLPKWYYIYVRFGAEKSLCRPSRLPPGGTFFICVLYMYILQLTAKNGFTLSGARFCRPRFLLI
uniref:Uncharacterized protein n=1 Tax=Siphoviridae sp. ctomJ2 TaxID=2827593 RepID=A0A8S5LKM2_9CAUD|nr:MAG TPA: hypothetical protein [Siphoviridae sp. ctomJ2]